MSTPNHPARAFFISPHLDDVALSCSKSIQSLFAKGFEIYIITIFSAAIDQAQAGKNSWNKVSYRKRKEEDHHANELLHAKEIHLDFLDAPFRNPKLQSFNRIFTTRPSEPDQLLKEIEKKISALIDTYRPEKIFSPLGIGWHIDHLTTFKCIRNLQMSRSKSTGLDFFYYEDRPYAFTSGSVFLRLLELGFWFHEGSSANNRLLQIAKGLFLALKNSFSWNLSSMAIKSHSSLLTIVAGIFSSLQRNLKILRFHSLTPARSLQTNGTSSDLTFALSVAKKYISQFEFLYFDDEAFISINKKYSSQITPNSFYSERLWII